MPPGYASVERGGGCHLSGCPGLKLPTTLWGSMYGVDVRGVLNVINISCKGLKPEAAAAARRAPAAAGGGGGGVVQLQVVF